VLCGHLLLGQMPLCSAVLGPLLVLLLLPQQLCPLLPLLPLSAGNFAPSGCCCCCCAQA
jgi:hypothetical protein